MVRWSGRPHLLSWSRGLQIQYFLPRAHKSSMNLFFVVAVPVIERADRFASGIERGAELRGRCQLPPQFAGIVGERIEPIPR